MGTRTRVLKGCSPPYSITVIERHVRAHRPGRRGRSSSSDVDFAEEAGDLVAQGVRLVGKPGCRFENVLSGAPCLAGVLVDAADIVRDRARPYGGLLHIP